MLNTPESWGLHLGSISLIPQSCLRRREGDPTQLPVGGWRQFGSHSLGDILRGPNPWVALREGCEPTLAKGYLLYGSIILVQALAYALTQRVFEVTNAKFGF